RVWSAVRTAVPADYEARVRPSAAVGDLVHVAALMSADDDARITTSFGRTLDSLDREWRFRVFLRDRPATIAELVPILEYLGLPPVDEHPSEF
ncbi:NAD-glutamate dehydrogenase domain-containing protein, partial [Flavihumibacter cheonanensis]|uniref:NAD-glutamate dehydrogenase domain-containing protein n=1 Tax=Flavihumibacter cheonanensis TaxID=1442385 RepID=UPI001EF91309